MLGSFTKFALGALAVLSAPAALADDYIETDAHYLRAHTLDPPYINDGFQMRTYDFGGDTIVNSMGHIRLTPDLPSRRGWLWSTVPLPDEYWKVEFEFKVGGKGGYLYGDGMGFFVTQERATPGPVFGNRDYFNGLGVFFDTYPNGKHDFSIPFVMGMIGDGKTSYDHANDGVPNMQGHCEAYFRNLEEPTKASVTYLRGHFINLQLKLQPQDKWINCFTITNVTLPHGSFLGFTALTGDISDNHDIISVHAETLRAEAIKNYNHLPNVQLPTMVAHKSSSHLGLFFKLLVVAGFAGGLFVAYKKYAADSAKRF